MSPTLWGGIVLLLLFALVGLRLPIAIALMAAGVVGYAGLDGFGRALLVAGTIPGEMIRGYSFSVVPLFVLMGTIASAAGMSRELYDAARALSRPGARGSLATATIGACALFGAICGSSIATAATMTRVSIPEMRRAGYADGFAAGAVAAGGTLGILIPPSVILVIYALLAEESVPALFAAAFIPGALLTLFTILVAKGLATREGVAPPIDTGAPSPRRALLSTWKLGLVFALSIGGIYLGWFSPTEGAAVGAAVTMLIAIATRTISAKGLWLALREAVITSAGLFFVFLGALMFARFIALTRIPVFLVDTVQAAALPTLAVLAIIVATYIVLGCILETVSMILITVPVFLPLIVSLGYDPVWFGILVVIVAEMGLITPPIGMNIFVIRSQLPDIPLGTLFAGVAPFLLAHLALILTLIALPQITSFLPRLLL
ncbi:TRAP transporter large permease [Acuticoccus kandeliae]|uniref:TRAP transporter large permease n=1 Tax=Acuticoccus kandeliae TaxID=2073160 RepID=UPI000D3E628B|nr:TRAP transporter large permease [Acuticoccus kandeliae]